MLTDTIERDRIKCCEYWPLQLGEENGIKIFSFSVILNSEEVEETGLIKRMFKLVDLENPQVIKSVTHYQYKDWPDHGVPPSKLFQILNSFVFQKFNYLTKKFKAMNAMKKLIQIAQSMEAPVVIHCSAGIGRTGAFLAILLTLQKVKNYLSQPNNTEPYKFNIFLTAIQLRNQRWGMIQQAAQYTFVYEVVHSETENLKLSFIPKKEVQKPPPQKRLNTRDRAYTVSDSPQAKYQQPPNPPKQPQSKPKPKPQPPSSKTVNQQNRKGSF